MSKEKTNESGLPMGRALTAKEVQAYNNKQRLEAKKGEAKAPAKKPAKASKKKTAKKVAKKA